MTGIVGVAALLTVLALSLLITRLAALAELDRWRADVGGEEAHHRAVREQRQEISEEQRRDQERSDEP